MAARSWRYGLSRNLFLLGFVSLLTDVSSEMLFPLIPFFVLALGGTVLVVGAIEGAADSMSSLVKVFAGHASDRAGRQKSYVVAGYGLSAVTKYLYPIVPGWAAFFGVRLADRAGKGIRDPPRDVLIVKSTPADSVGKAFGFHRAMDTVGAILGPLIVLLLLPIFLLGRTDLAAYRLVFVVAAIPATLAFVVALLVREVVRAPHPRPFRVSLSSLPPRLRAFVLIAALYSFANISYVFLVLRAGDAAGTTAAIALYLLFNVVYAANATQAGGLSDRLGRLPVLLVGYGAFIATALVFALRSELVWLVIGFVLYGLSFALVEGVQRAVVADLAPAEVRGTALGTYHMAIGLTKLPSGLVAGALLVNFGFAGAFGFAAVGAMAALVGLAVLFARHGSGRKLPA